IADVPGVRAVEPITGGLVDLGNRRLWVLAWPSSSRLEFLNGQVIRGSGATAKARLRAGGWVTVSKQVAAEHHVGIGGVLRLPTAAGELSLKVAALTTNFGWSPGALVLNRADYARAWTGSQPTALLASTREGADQSAVRDEIERALGPGNGL